MKRRTQLTLVGILIGIIFAAAIGVLMYILNKQNRFD
jgi:hypothetical protein